MSGWREATLGDVCELKRGYDLPKGSRGGGSIPVISSSGPTGWHDEAKVKAPGVVTGRYGTLGQVFYVTEDFWPLNTSLYVRDFKGNDPKFVATLLRSLDLGRYDGAAAVPGLNRNHLHTLPVRVPELPIQRTIAHVAQGFDDLIENNRRRVEVLEEMARAIYREWFVKFRYPGHEDVSLVDSALGPIPEEWTTPRLAELVSTQYGYTESAATEPVGPKYLRGMDINKTSFIDWSSVPYCPIDDGAVDRFRVQVGDVFVIRMADPGKVGICETEVDAVFASYLVRLRPTTDSLRPHFLFFTLADAPYQGWVTGASTGATRKSVSAKVMTEPQIALPPVRIQKSFEAAVGPMREALTTLVRENAKLVGLRELLLPRLVTGKIDVSTLDLDGLVEDQVA
jgi:type I restriction enzyme S subunit